MKNHPTVSIGKNGKDILIITDLYDNYVGTQAFKNSVVIVEIILGLIWLFGTYLY